MRDRQEGKKNGKYKQKEQEGKGQKRRMME